MPNKRKILIFIVSHFIFYRYNEGEMVNLALGVFGVLMIVVGGVMAHLKKE